MDGRSNDTDQLRQNVHYSPKSTWNPIDDYYYSYEPVTPVQDANPVPWTPPRPLEEEQHYSQRQHRPLDRLIYGNY